MPTALVTGGGIRIGRAIVLALGRAGYDVVVHANRSVSEAEGVVRQLATLGRQGRVEQADLAAPDGPAHLAGRIERLDLLVNNAAAYEHADFRTIVPAQLERMLAVNVRAPFLLTQALLPLLEASGQGAVVNVTDMAVSRAYSPSHHFAHYLASKGALEQLTRALALELGPKVRVNAVAPGPVAIAAETTSEQRADMLARLPLGREGSPDDVGEAVVYLAKACYVTGQTIRVCGGLSIA
ncbi:MAG: SDR family NAD(P)-dependent oxidoreductase [Planctomycetia bacterium]